MRQIYPKLLASLVFLSMSLIGGVFAQAPVNDDVCNAINLTTYDSLYVFDNFNTTVEPGEENIVPTNTDGLSNVGWFEQGLTSTVWFTFTAPGTGAVRIDLCNDSTQFDTQIAIYEVGTCSDFTTFRLKGANDDIPGPNPQTGGCPAPGNEYASIVDVPCLTPGATYYILIDGWFAAGTSADTVGKFGMTLEEIPAPAIAPLQVSLVTQGPLCPGINDGFVATNLVGGYPTTTFVWNNGTTDNAISGLGPGTYSVTVDDGCSAAFSDTVTLSGVSTDPLVENMGDTVTLCRGDTLALNTLTDFSGGVPLLKEQIFGIGLNVVNQALQYSINTHNVRNTGNVGEELIFPTGSEYTQGDFALGLFWTINEISNDLEAYDPATGNLTTVTNLGIPLGDDVYGGLTIDPTTNIAYVLTAGNGTPIPKVYSADLSAGAIDFQFVTDLDSSLLMLFVDFDTTGTLYGLEFPGDLVTIDKNTWQTTVIGNVGYLANFLQDGDFDPVTNTLYLAALSDDFTGVQLRVADINSGSTFSLGTMNGVLSMSGFAIGPPRPNQPNYNYSWTPPIGWTAGSTQDNPFTATRVDRTYSVQATDQCNSTAVGNVTVDVLQPFAITLNASGDDGNGNGTVNVAITNGTPPFDILWNTGDMTESVVGLTAGTYTVTVSDACFSRTDSVTVIATSIEDLVNAGLESVELFPNPTKNMLNIEMQLNKVGAVNIDIMDAKGGLVYKNTLDKSNVYSPSIDMSEFASGVYIVRLTTEEGTIYRKISKE